jgi:hypothetical protein
MNEAMQTVSASMKFAGPYTVSAGSKWAAVLCGLGLLVLLYLATAVSGWGGNPAKLVEGADGRASTSKFQWFLWIAAILFAYTTLWVLRAEQGIFSALSVTPAGLLTALGLSTATAVAAKGITSAYIRSGRVTKLPSSSAVPAGAESAGTRPAGGDSAGAGPTESMARGGILRDDSGRPELAKIQMVGFTILTIGIFLATVIHQVVSHRPITSLPDIDTSLVVLLSISLAGYLGKKLVTANALTVPSALRRIMPPTRSWSSVGLAVAALVIVFVVVGAIFGRQGLEHTTSTGHWGGLLAFAFLCSLISFAVVETAKRLLPWRQFSQERYLLQWWTTRAKAAVVPVEESWTELVEALDIRSSVSSIFGLPIQLLAAQVSAAADLALAEPSRHPLLYFALTRSAEDVRKLRDKFGSQRKANFSAVAPAGAGESSPAETSESGDGQELLTEMASEWKKSRQPGADSNNQDLLQTPDDADDSQSFQAAQRARAAIDSLQVTVGERWRRLVQATAVLVAAFAGLLIQLAQPSDSRWIYIMAAALIGGPLAWTIRDLAAAIERWRR